MSNNFTIQKFDMNRITGNPVVVFIGKRNTGKSFCVRDLLYHKRDIPIARVISGTDHANPFYSKFTPPIFVSSEFSDDTVSKFVKRQQDISAKQKQLGFENIDNRGLLILDDLMFDKGAWVNSRNIANVFCNGRHYGINFIITLQFCLGIPPTLRNNVDYIFIFREARMVERKKLYEHWATIIPTFEMFCELMDSCTNDYGCLVIDNASRSSRLEDNVFYYKAQDNGPFRLCSDRAWSFSERQVHNNRNSATTKGKKYNFTFKK